MRSVSVIRSGIKRRANVKVKAMSSTGTRSRRKGLMNQRNASSSSPEEVVKHVMVEKNRDLATLVTCTPYGVNSHRLLVHAHRVENEDIETEVNFVLSDDTVIF